MYPREKLTFVPCILKISLKYDSPHATESGQPLEVYYTPHEGIGCGLDGWTVGASTPVPIVILAEKGYHLFLGIFQK